MTLPPLEGRRYVHEPAEIARHLVGLKLVEVMWHEDSLVALRFEDGVTLHLSGSPQVEVDEVYGYVEVTL